MSLATKFVSFDRLKRYTQHVKSYVGQQILNVKGEWAKQLNLKVDKVEGKGLSTNDFTTELKNKLNGIEVGAQVNTVTGIKGNAESAYRKGDVNLTPANIGAVASSNGDASNTKVTFTQSTSRVNLTSGDTLKTAFGKLSKWFVDLKAVAFSGSYNDLSNKPTTLKNPKSLTIQQNGGNQTEYDGSTALTVNITKAGIGLGNVENKSSATIRSELTSSNVTTALGYTPINSSATQLTNQSLDAYKGTDYMGKMYYGAGSNSVTGKPSGVDNFWMWVTRNGTHAFSQILMDNKCQLYIRYHDANSWSAWKRVNSSATQLTNQSLDAYKGTDYMGEMYYGAGSNSVTGKPSGVDNFWMWVTRNGTHAFSQILMDNKCQLYIRYHDANSWSAWKQVISSGNNISLLNNDRGYQTLQQVEDKINEIVSSGIGQVTTFSFQVVEELPSSGTSNHIYLVPISGSTESDNYYEEYCYINSKWELIGTTKVDLTAYAKKTDIPTALKNPNAMTLQINGTSQGTYDGSAAKTYNVSKESLGLGNVENKSSATIRDELTSVNVTKALGFTPISKVTVDSALSSSSTNPVQNKVVNAALSRKLTKTINEYNAETICLCTHSKSGTVHTLVKKNSNDYYSTVKFVATADFTYGDTFRLGSASSPTVVTPKTEDGELLNTGAFKKGSVVIAYTGDTAETVNTLFFKVGGGLSDAKLAAADAEPGDVRTGKKFYAGDKTIKTGTMPNQGAKTAALNAGESYTIPQGWHNGKGKVTANSLASQTSANAENGDIISGKTAWVNGSKRTGTLQDLGYAPKGTGCALYNGGVYIYFGDSSSRYALSRSVWYPQGDIKNILSFGGSGSGNKNGGETDIHRDGNNIVAKGYTVSSASASISGKTVTVNVHAHFRLNNNGNVNVPNGNLSSVDYSFSFNIG